MDNSTGQKKYQFAATCGAGTETLVAAEIAQCKGKAITEGRGVIHFSGNLECGLRACLWSRIASRVLLEIGSFPVSSEDDLYNGALKVKWTEHLDIETTFAVDCTVASSDTKKIHSKFGSLRVKDAIVDQMRETFGSRPSVDVNRPGVRVHVLVKEDTAHLSIDLSGDSLHRRGYRVDKGLAPLKENLAAAIIVNSGWEKFAASDCALVDPLCGSATLLIEAALIYGDSAPGLSRNYFGFMGWKQHDKKLWNSLVQEALDREDAGMEKEWPVIVGYDSNPQTIRAARGNVKMAGLDDKITVEKSELAFLQPPQSTKDESTISKGLVISNLPFGERLSDTEEVAQLYKAFGRIMKERFGGYRVGAFISNPELTDSFSLQWQDKYRLFNGPLQCRLLVSEVVGENLENKPFSWHIQDYQPEGQGADFANRLKKNLKKYIKWAKKEGISCFRVYDKDLAEYNVSVDIYGKWVHVQEYAPPSTVSAKISGERFKTVLREIRMVLGIRADRLFIKTRERQRGKSQYQKKSAKKKMFEVQEGNCRYLVNFTDYLDTGLFLDHRPVRQRIHDKADGKRFLNLFGYTGTATVQAVVGGAVSTTTVDLSHTYLRWVKMNLSLNGFDTVRNRVVHGDCMQWLKEDDGTYDLIFIDPPTFSNTKKEKRVFDVQRDHQELLRLGMNRLSENGLLIFSTNFRRFKLDKEVMEMYEVNNISRASIPLDFSRNQKIHMCWELKHK